MRVALLHVLPISCNSAPAPQHRMFGVASDSILSQRRCCVDYTALLNRHLLFLSGQVSAVSRHEFLITKTAVRD